MGCSGGWGATLRALALDMVGVWPTLPPSPAPSPAGLVLQEWVATMDVLQEQAEERGPTHRTPPRTPTLARTGSSTEEESSTPRLKSMVLKAFP